MSHLILSLLPKPRRPIIRVQPDVSIKQCLANMHSEDIGALLVTDDDENQLSILSERDLVRKCLYKNRDVNTTTASEIACSNISILEADDTVEKAMETMTHCKRRHILIREQGEIVAIVSIGEILFHLLKDNQKLIEHLENYIYSH